MNAQSGSDSLQTLQDIRGIMERSSRFLSLSGWSGVWAGCTALVSAAIAWSWMATGREHAAGPGSLGYAPVGYPYEVYLPWKFVLLALATLTVALAGGFYFTRRKAMQDGVRLWSRTSRQLLVQIAIPLAAGGIFAFSLLYYNQPQLVAACCLMFYGLALINGSKHTLGEIRALGFLELVLGCVNLFLPRYGLLLWALGFGLLHLLYGILMWNKYDRRAA